MTTWRSGYMTSPGYDGISRLPWGVDVTKELTVPDGHVVMISFQRVDVCSPKFRPRSPPLELSIVGSKQKATDFSSAGVYKTSAVAIRLHVDRCVKKSTRTGFNMSFSFHPVTETPPKLGNGLFDCSVAYYSAFRHHLDCNLRTECQDGRDETHHCPYSSVACKGKVASGNKCLVHVSRTVLADLKPWLPNPYDGFRSYCRHLGGNLVTIKSLAELADFSKLFQTGETKSMGVHTGMTYGDVTIPNVYRYVWVGDDKSVLYNTYTGQPREAALFGEDRLCLVYWDHGPFHFRWKECSYFLSKRVYDGVCEIQHSDSNINPEGISLYQDPNVTESYENFNQTFVKCPDGHVTHLFLSCDVKGHCGQSESVSVCEFPNKDVVGRHIHTETAVSVGMFECDKGDTTIHFTQVCDCRDDCADRSDEYFCKHPPCDGFRCSCGQCVTYESRCDLLSHCADGSDERDCGNQFRSVAAPSPSPPAIITLGSKGSFSFTTMEANESCPDTHYRCPGAHNYCLPVYTRCNGFYDCLGREDEEGCEEVTCPGFYRCRASSVCVHPDHLCDGWPQCPQHDDEVLCGLTCPGGCLCHGHAFVCTHPFSACDFPQLRYLKASGSGLTVSALNTNFYLIHLILDKCGLTHVPSVHLPNLRYMDLSYNDVETLDVNVFLSMENARVLKLGGNPVKSLFSTPSKLQQVTLESVDLSQTSLEIFQSKSFSRFPLLQKFNLSYTNIHTIGSDGFRFIPTLRVLDMTRSPVLNFPSDLFRGLEGLQSIISPNYKLCCQRLLPQNFNQRFCTAPQSEVSSCDDLLRSETYRGFLWLISAMSLSGNAFCFIVRLCVQKAVAKVGFHVFVTHLSLADLLMGVYMAIIGVADELFRGQYLLYDSAWTHSAACKVAGFLSLLSSEVSAFIILLITLDRLVVIRFPFSELRFGRRSALAACVAAWVVGLVLAAVPLLPLTSHWQFYSQTGICIPLPVTRQDFQGRGYAFGVLIVLNFVLFMVIAAGQASIYRSVQQNTMTTSETSSKSRDLTVARRLITVAATDFLCWFPIGLCGLLVLAGVAVPGEVNVAMAIFVLPLNSALNPFLYTFNTLVEKRRRKKEEHLLRLLESALEAEDKTELNS
ncbi:hypothetical protein V1264_002917 [Littorina saxatilis]|uniref:G-protein coupled receptors family 1 profile domain-containing protein n=1 Tax=Littorina saxatilis TaxID=31220 RepID=A0AAN9B3N4_9CAEN